MDTDQWNNESWGRENEYEPGLEVMWVCVIFYDRQGKQKRRVSKWRKIYEQRRCSGGKMKTAFEKYSYYKFTISNTTIKISYHKKSYMLQWKEHPGKEMRSNSLYEFGMNQNH